MAVPSWVMPMPSMLGGAGNDLIYGGDAGDLASGDDGADWIEGGYPEITGLRGVPRPTPVRVTGSVQP